MTNLPKQNNEVLTGSVTTYPQTTFTAIEVTQRKLKVTPKLKNATQQKRVELIETQKWELIAATATIDNLKLEYQGKLDLAVSALENSLEIKNRTIKKQSDELEKLGETCGNLVRTKLRNESAIKDLTKRNGNLKTITNDQTERIEVMQHELKNYESAIKVYESRVVLLKDEIKWLQNDISVLKIKNEKSTESRERLASKFTNWFIFLVFIFCVELAVIVAMILRAVNYNLPIF